MLLRLKPVVLVTMLAWWLAFSVPLLAELLISEALLQRIEKEYDSDARQRVESWQQLMQESQALSEVEKLALVNDFFNNNVMFVDDILLWNKEDYWATPIEMLSIARATVKIIPSPNISP